MANDLKAQLVVDAVNMALTRAPADERDLPFRTGIAVHLPSLWPALQG